MEIKGPFPSTPDELDTLLFDLDGTLVGLDRPRLELWFTMRAIGRFVTGIPPWRFKRAFWAAAEIMQTHETDRTNYDVLVSELAARSRWSPDRIDGKLRRLVERDFPRMARYFGPLQGAREVLDLARARGFRVVLATNPVWPEAAVAMRLGWGGLGDFAFDLVTHSECMTRCKPHVSYYRELLDRLGARPQSCLMIGNDAVKDLPAKELGVHTFLVVNPADSGAQATIADPRLDAYGSLADLRAWLAGAAPGATRAGSRTPGSRDA